jgi:hypothetical protein
MLLSWVGRGERKTFDLDARARSSLYSVANEQEGGLLGLFHLASACIERIQQILRQLQLYLCVLSAVNFFFYSFTPGRDSDSA